MLERARGPRVRRARDLHGRRAALADLGEAARAAGGLGRCRGGGAGTRRRVRPRAGAPPPRRAHLRRRGDAADARVRAGADLLRRQARAGRRGRPRDAGSAAGSQAGRSCPTARASCSTATPQTRPSSPHSPASPGAAPSRCPVKLDRPSVNAAGLVAGAGCRPGSRSRRRCGSRSASALAAAPLAHRAAARAAVRGHAAPVVGGPARGAVLHTAGQASRGSRPVDAGFAVRPAAPCASCRSKPGRELDVARRHRPSLLAAALSPTAPGSPSVAGGAVPSADDGGGQGDGHPQARLGLRDDLRRRREPHP